VLTYLFSFSANTTYTTLKRESRLFDKNSNVNRPLTFNSMVFKDGQ
jgi:hypothetical protein